MADTVEQIGEGRFRRVARQRLRRGPSRSRAVRAHQAEGGEAEPGLRPVMALGQLPEERLAGGIVQTEQEGGERERDDGVLGRQPPGALEPSARLRAVAGGRLLLAALPRGMGEAAEIGALFERLGLARGGTRRQAPGPVERSPRGVSANVRPPDPRWQPRQRANRAAAVG